MGEVEAGLGESFGEGVIFKVKWNKGEIGGSVDSGFGEFFALPLLRGGKVNFKDAERRVRIAIGEGVEPGTENDVLRDAVCNGFSEEVFCVAASDSHKGAEVARDRMRGALKIALEAEAKERKDDGIVEDERPLHELMRGAADGDAERGAAGLAVLHAFECRGARVAWWA